MKTNIEILRNVNKEKFETKCYNIYIGISLGNKWFTKNHIRELILWSLKHTKKTIAVQIADRLHAINYEVRNNMNRKSALQRALNKGDQIIELIKEIINEFPKTEQQRIEIVRWDVIEKEKTTLALKKVIYEEFDSNNKFRETILNLVRSHTTKEDRKFSEEQVNYLAKYILEELPEMLNGFHYKRTHYNLWVYPGDHLLLKLVEDIQKKKAFRHLHDKATIGNNGFIALNIID